MLLILTDCFVYLTCSRFCLGILCLAVSCRALLLAKQMCNCKQLFLFKGPCQKWVGFLPRYFEEYCFTRTVSISLLITCRFQHTKEAQVINREIWLSGTSSHALFWTSRWQKTSLHHFRTHSAQCAPWLCFVFVGYQFPTGVPYPPPAIHARHDNTIRWGQQQLSCCRKLGRNLK